jgi:GTP-binding protein
VKTRKFIDSAPLYLKAGKGGDGVASFRREKFVANGGPDGGDGGHGGSIILQCDYDTDSLIDIYFAPHRKAEAGGSGRGKQMHGKTGKDLYIKVPCGTEVHNKETGELIVDILETGSEYVVANGGKGGLGNIHWKRATHQAPRECTAGTPGEDISLKLELKIAADIGLVGFPNAGKSSLLTKISDAHPKIASYPFTTLNPIIGTIIFEDYSRLRVADIPGLIEGAHQGIGLGHAFLRHIERSSFLIYIIDMAGVDTRKPFEDLQSLKEELRLHRQELSERPTLVVANKMDLPEAAENLKEFKEKTGINPIEISATEETGIPELKEAIFNMSRG